MNEREQIIQLWFKMWLTQQDLGMDDIFAEDVIYTESWSPKYNRIFIHQIICMKFSRYTAVITSFSSHRPF